MLANAETWPEVFGYLAIAVGVVGVAWAWAWASVHNSKNDPFWNRKKADAD